VIYYHGTTKRIAEAIQREGLRPHRETAYDTAINGWPLRELPGEAEQVIYLTKFKGLATQFAIFRAKYEMAQPGENIITDFFPEQNKNFSARSCECVEEPVVIALDVPKEIEKQLDQDIQAAQGKICACTIGPEHIVKVMPANEDDIYRDTDYLESALLSELLGAPEIQEAVHRKGYL
jgi:hypothetical protein